MKKIGLCIILLSTLMLTSCADLFLLMVEMLTVPSIDSKSGLEKFHYAVSSIGLTDGLIPDGFLEMYQYEDGDFDYYSYFFHDSYETALLYLRYDEDEYLKAKDYCKNNMELYPDQIEQCNGYTFIKAHSREKTDKYYAYSDDRYFAYSDESCTLLFLGAYTDGHFVMNYTSVEQYIEHFFPFYNFEEGKIERTQAQTETVTSVHTEKASSTGEISKPETETKPPVKTK